MKNVKEINIKHGTCYFLIDMINIKEFDSNLLRIDKKSYKDIDISHVDTLQLKKNDDYENIYSVNPFYLMIGKADGYIKEKNESKYLVFDPTDENREVLEKYTELGDGIKNDIKAINGGKEGE